MAAFEYQALDPRGRDRRGVMSADTSRQVRQSLREQGLTPVAVTSVREADFASQTLTRRGRLKPVERALVIRQLAELLDAGLPLADALETVADQADRTSARRVLVSLRSRVMEGQTLADAMAEFPGAFGELESAIVAAGERSGRLVAVLSRLADYADERLDLGRSTLLALIYPMLLALVAIGVVTALMAYVVPEVATVFEGFGGELPWLTRAMMATSEFLIQWGWLLIVLLMGLMAASVSAWRYPPTRARLDRFFLSLPVAGRLIRTGESARFARTLSILVDSAVPLLDSLKIAQRVMRNQRFKLAVSECTVRVREGSSLNRALEAVGEFPPLLSRLVAGGEKGGHLARVLSKAADIFDRESNTASRVFTAIAEPLLILLVGGLVLVIVLAILLPIFQLNQLIK